MTNSEKRVAIARDVIQRLNSDGSLLTAGHNGYICSPVKFPDDSGDLKDRMEDIDQAPCMVCALGATLLSKARLFNNVPLATITDNNYFLHVSGHTARQNLRDVFPTLMLDMIEAAYEMRPMGTWLPEKLRKTVNFGTEIKDPKQRMIAIMQNIIDNGGEFIV